MTEEQQRAAVLKAALSWLGTPYHHQAMRKGVGVDCLTLIVASYREAGLVKRIKLPHYPKDFMLHNASELYLGGLLDYSREVETPGPADIVIWKFGKCFSHAGLVIEWPNIIHSMAGRECLLDDAERAQGLLFDKGGKPRERKFLSYWGK